MRIALASCVALPEPDVDEPLLVEALRAAGAHPAVLAWDDPHADFASHDLVVIRSTWNYHEHLAAFRAWVARTARATRLVNPAAIVHANVEKTYLRDLEARGVDVVPTAFVPRATSAGSLDALMTTLGTDKVVVKPVVSLGSYRTAAFTRDTVDDGQRFLDELTRDRDAMVQRWMTAVDTEGERSLVWIDGTFTHAIRKAPRFAGGVESVSHALPVSEDERAIAERALAPIAKDLAYARVDTIREDGVLRIMELELVEPSLFFRQHPPALERFVAAILRRAAAQV